MKKRKTNALGNDIYLLGKDKDGILYWLVAASWDCDWYWSSILVTTYTSNEYPERSKDITSWQYFDSLFFDDEYNGFESFKNFFVETPLNNKEIWTLCELIMSFYIARKYSDMLHIGGAHYTNNPAKEIIKDEGEYKRINETVIPAIMGEVYELLSPNE